MPASNPPKPLVLSASAIQGTAPEHFTDRHAGGTVSWRTLVSAPQTRTNSLTVGMATCAPGESGGCGGGGQQQQLKAHRHAQAEVYYFTRGKGIVTVEGEEYEVGAGSVVWIPGDAEHGVRNVAEGDGEEELVWLYVFAADEFQEVVYRFAEVERGRGRGEGAANTRAKL